MKGLTQPRSESRDSMADGQSYVLKTSSAEFSEQQDDYQENLRCDTHCFGTILTSQGYCTYKHRIGIYLEKIISGP